MNMTLVAYRSHHPCMSLGCRVSATIGFGEDVSYGPRLHRYECQRRIGMIRRVEIRNLKRFKELDCELGNHMVIVGPNNCGKTTLLQSIAIWSEIASHWAQYNPDLAREGDGNYPSSNLRPRSVSSIPLATWDQLWPARDVADPVSIRLDIDGSVLGFELFYDRGSVSVRPMRDVSESLLDGYRQEPFAPIYIPPMSGVDLREPPYQPEVIPARLARGQGGTVLRNLLLGVSGDATRWSELQEIVADLFGYELTLPSAGADEIVAGYREGPERLSLDYSSGAAGFLQIVMVYAAIFQQRGSVMLIDEPDAHLHIVLQERLYRDLRERARRHKWQLIIATHSERIIREARPDVLRLLSDGLYQIDHRQRLVDTLRLDNVDLVMAQQFRRILYVEGKTDLEILRAWATVLEHPLTGFLEEPFWKPMAEDDWKTDRHFAAMRDNVPDLSGVDLRDRNDRREGVGASSPPEGMKRLVWDRYEIESYLIHPDAILRWLESWADETAVGRADRYMKRFFPPAIYEEPFETDYFEGRKGKDVLGDVCDAARLRIHEVEYSRIAVGMLKEEIHPEVVETLNQMAEHLSVGG